MIKTAFRFKFNVSLKGLYMLGSKWCYVGKTVGNLSLSSYLTPLEKAISTAHINSQLSGAKHKQ